MLMTFTDIHVHSAIFEVVTPLVILKTIASGLPLIACDLPYYQGYLVNRLNFLLVPPKDANCLQGARIIDELLSDNTLRPIFGSVTRKVIERFFS